jgi:hypothetical protein
VAEQNTAELELRQQGLSIVERAQTIKIVDEPTYHEAANLLTNVIMPWRKRWNMFWEEIREPAYTAYKAILAKRDEGDQKAAAAEAHIKAQIQNWTWEQERLRREAQRAAEEAERRRLEAERLEQEVLLSEMGASDAEIEKVVSVPIVPVVEEVEATYMKAAGVSTRENWHAVVTDVKALCLAIAKGQVPATYVEPNMKALNARAKADKESMKIPGVTSKNTPVVAGRTR